MSVYSDAMAGFEQAPTWLVVLAITSIVLGAALLLLLGWHVVRRILDVPRIPRGAGTYTVLVGACVLSIGSGATALAVAAALDDWQSQAGPAAVAEVQCRRTGPTRVEVSYIPLGPDGKRGAEEKQSIESLPCEIAVERLHFPQALVRLGLIERHRLARVGSFVRPTATPVWRALPQPMGLPIASAEAQQVAIPTEDGAPYRVFADDRGVRVEKLAR
jgi:hypothetical protein